MRGGPDLPSATRGRRVWLHVGCLFDGVGPEPLRGAHVVYDADSILHVGGLDRPPPPELRAPAGAGPDLVLEDYTLLPGLIEAHAHLFLEGGELDPERRRAAARRSPAELLRAAQSRLERIVRMGIVAIRDAGDVAGVGLALAALSKRADRPLMPDVESPGAAIHRRGHYGAFFARPLEDHASARECVRSRVADGADSIKLVATGVVDMGRGSMSEEPQLSGADVRELVEASRELGRQTFAHASGEEGIERVIEGGVGSVEHGYFVRPDQLARLRDGGIAWTPTLAPVRQQRDHGEEWGQRPGTATVVRSLLDQHARAVLRAHELGVTILAGSDAGSPGVPHGLGLLDELELLEQVGLPPSAVLAAATGNGAAQLRAGTKLGQVCAGFASRFILTRHSPLERIANLMETKIVVFDGVAYPSRQPPEAAGL